MKQPMPTREQPQASVHVMDTERVRTHHDDVDRWKHFGTTRNTLNLACSSGLWITTTLRTATERQRQHEGALGTDCGKNTRDWPWT
jgi:hypothetical protein